MSDVLNTVVDKKAFEQVQELEEGLRGAHQALLAFMKDAGGANININAKSFKELDDQIKKSAEYQKQLNKHQSESDKIQKALENSRKSLAQALSKENKEIQKNRLEAQQANKLTKDQVKSSSDLVGAYTRTSTQLNLMRKAYKDLAIRKEQGEKLTKKEIRDMEKLGREVRELDGKLKKVDATVGQHQRNVGNYQSALGGLHPALDRVDQGLNNMGSSLDDIANSDNPFGALTDNIKKFGRAAITFLLSPIGLAITAIGSLFMLINRNKDTVIEFDSQLLDVGKTTGITGAELESLGGDIIKLSRNLKTVGTPALLEYATVAGQLGVKGRENILAFAEGLAKLETASNISGEEGAAQIARLLTLTDGGVQNIQDFGDEIVILGNNFAATESEILSNATAIAQNTAVYKVGRRDVLAYATATKAVGVEAELTGSTIGRSLGQFEKAIRTGKNLETIMNLTGKSAGELGVAFKENASGVFQDFISGLNQIDKSGGSVNEQLANIGITSVRDQRVLGSLATAGFDTLTEAIEKTSEAAGAMDAEFAAASQKLEKQLGRLSIAWDNLVLSIENGQGVFGKTFAFLAGVGADTLEAITKQANAMSALFGGLSNMFSQWKTEMRELVETIVSLADIEIDFLNPQKMADSAKGVFDKLKNQLGGEGAKNIGKAFVEGYIGTLQDIKDENILKGAMEGSTNSFGGLEDPEPDGKRAQLTPMMPEQETKDYMEGTIAYYENLIKSAKEHQKTLATTSEEYKFLGEQIGALEDAVSIIDGTWSAEGFLKPTDAEKLEIDDFLNTEGIMKGMKSLSDVLGQDMNGLFMEFVDLYGMDYDKFKEWSEKKIAQSEKEGKLKKEHLAEYLRVSSDIIYNVGQLFSAQSDRKIAKLEEEMAAQDEYYANAIEAEEGNAVRQEELRQEQERNRKKLQKKQNKEKEEQARKEKMFTAFDIILNTAAAVAEFGFITPMGIAAAAMGALQLATVLSTPVPKYAKGREDGPEELAITGDGGKQEVITDSKGRFKALTPKTPTLTYLSKGDKVFPDIPSFQEEYSYEDLKRASVMTSLQDQQQKLSSAEAQNNFNMNLIVGKIKSEIKEGFKNAKITNNNHNDNSGLANNIATAIRNQNLRDKI